MVNAVVDSGIENFIWLFLIFVVKVVINDKSKDARESADTKKVNVIFLNCF